MSSPLLVAAPLYVCPGPLFTNDIHPAQAQAQGCSLAQQGRWSQAQAPELPKAPAPLASTALPSSATTSDKANTSANTPPANSVANSPPTPTAVPLAQSFLLTSPTLPPGSSAPGTSTPALPVRAALPKPETQAAPAEPGSDGFRQRQRDRHARDIVLAELASTQARIQSLSARPQVSADDENALQRLRRDEDALRRELARRPG